MSPDFLKELFSTQISGAKVVIAQSVREAYTPILPGVILVNLKGRYAFLFIPNTFKFSKLTPLSYNSTFSLSVNLFEKKVNINPITIINTAIVEP